VLVLAQYLARAVLSVHLREKQLPVKLVSGLTVKQELVAIAELDTIALMDLVEYLTLLMVLHSRTLLDSNSRLPMLEPLMNIPVLQVTIVIAQILNQTLDLTTLQDGVS
jgi:hypothetical protein